MYRRYGKVDGTWGIGIGLVEQFWVRILASSRTDNYVYHGLAEWHWLARTLREVRISLELRLTYLSKVIGAVGFALERAEVRRSIPRTSISRVEEGRVDSKHVKGLSQHLIWTWNMLMAPCAQIPMLKKKLHGCQNSKVLCTCEFAVYGDQTSMPLSLYMYHKAAIFCFDMYLTFIKLWLSRIERGYYMGDGISRKRHF